MIGFLIVLGVGHLIGNRVDEWKSFIILTGCLHEEGSDISVHDLLNDILSCLLFFWLDWGAVDSGDVHAGQVDIIVKVIDDCSELVEQELDKAILEYIFLLSKVVILDPAESFANPDEIVWSIIGDVFNGVQDGGHLINDLLRSGQFVQSEQVFFQIEIEVAFEIAEPDWILKDEIL